VRREMEEGREVKRVGPVCLQYQDDEYERLRQIAVGIRPPVIPSHICVEEKISHKIFQWHNATIDVITNTGVTLLEGEIQARIKPSEVAKKIEGIMSLGGWRGREIARPCKVVEKHYHEGIHHLHFKCSPFQLEGTRRIFEQLVKIAEEQK